MKTKTPDAVEGAKYCPLVGQGCIQDACMFWVTIWGLADGKPVEDKDCAINWQVELQRQTLVETARVTAAQDKVATETAGLSGVLATVAATRVSYPVFDAQEGP